MLEIAKVPAPSYVGTRNVEFEVVEEFIFGMVFSDFESRENIGNLGFRFGSLG